MSKVKVLVPVSGGKDSQACLKLALEHHPAEHIRGLFCDTQWEHPLTYEHVDRMRRLYGVRIDTITAGTVPGQVLKHRRWPSFGARFCTEELKIRPTRDYCRELAKEQGSFIAKKRDSVAAHAAARLGGFEVWYGMRSDESSERAKRYAGCVGDEVYPPHEVSVKYPKYLHKLGVTFRLAVLDWSTTDIKDYVGHEFLNPLYAEGFDRVGCFPCQAAGDPHKEKSYTFDDFGRRQHQRVIIISQHLNKNPFTSKSGIARHPEMASGTTQEPEDRGPGCMVCAI